MQHCPPAAVRAAAFGAALADDPDQQDRSSYVDFFQTPWLPETVFSFNNFSLLKTLLGGMSDEKMKEYISVFSEPGAMTSALNWYRALGDDLGFNSDDANFLEVNTPTLFLWGNQDSFLSYKNQFRISCAQFDFPILY